MRNDPGTRRIFLAGSNWRELDHIFGIEIGQFEPVFRDIRRREQIIFRVFLLQRLKQIVPGQMRFQFRLNCAFDRDALCAFDNRSNALTSLPARSPR